MINVCEGKGVSADNRVVRIGLWGFKSGEIYCFPSYTMILLAPVERFGS